MNQMSSNLLIGSFDNLSKMNIINIIFLIHMLSSESQSLKKIGTFWHISDIYWSTNPTRDKCSPDLTCLNKVFKELADKNSRLSPDFVLWSSAGGPYLKPVIRQMKKVIQTIPVFPSLAPVKLPASDKYILYYQNMSDTFGNWLDEQAHQTFWKAGYYSQNLGIPEKLQVIVLNTALFCNFHVASQLDDPAHQWTWLSLELIKARKAGRTVYLLLSATPGVAGTYSNRMFTSKHNNRYLAMVRTFSDVIKGQFGGYDEGNKFHIFYDKHERGCGWLMLAPPFHDSARLYLYDTETLEPLDYVQFYKSDQGWHVQHRFSRYFLTPNISVFSLELLFTRLQRNEDMFTKYISATTLSRGSDPNVICEKTTYRKTKMCSIIAVDYNSYLECMVQDNTAHLSGGASNNRKCFINSNLLLIKCIVSVLFLNKFCC